MHLNRRTNSILNALIAYTINTGLLTSMMCFVSMITHAVMPHNFIFIGVYFPLSGLYSNALLGSLNARDWFRRETESIHAIIPLSSLRTASTEQIEEPSVNPSNSGIKVDAMPVAVHVQVERKTTSEASRYA